MVHPKNEVLPWPSLEVLSNTAKNLQKDHFPFENWSVSDGIVQNVYLKINAVLCQTKYKPSTWKQRKQQQRENPTFTKFRGKWNEFFDTIRNDSSNELHFFQLFRSTFVRQMLIMSTLFFESTSLNFNSYFQVSWLFLPF